MAEAGRGGLNKDGQLNSMRESVSSIYPRQAWVAGSAAATTGLCHRPSLFSGTPLASQPASQPEIHSVRTHPSDTAHAPSGPRLSFRPFLPLAHSRL